MSDQKSHFTILTFAIAHTFFYFNQLEDAGKGGRDTPSQVYKNITPTDISSYSHQPLEPHTTLQFCLS